MSPIRQPLSRVFVARPLLSLACAHGTTVTHLSRPATVSLHKLDHSSNACLLVSIMCVFDPALERLARRELMKPRPAFDDVRTIPPHGAKPYSAICDDASLLAIHGAAGACVQCAHIPSQCPNTVSCIARDNMSERTLPSGWSNRPVAIVD